MSFVLSALAAAALFAAFGLLWRDPDREAQHQHDPRDPDRCGTCPLARGPDPGRDTGPFGGARERLVHRGSD